MNAPYWYLASYPKSGNTWCRIFICELLNLIEENNNKFFSKNDLKLNNDISTGEIISNRYWIDDQLGFDSSDLDFEEIDKLRGNIIQNNSIYYEGFRYFKVHDSFFTKSNNKQPIVNCKNCSGVVYILRNPLDVAVSMSYFFKWEIDYCVNFLLDDNAALCSSRKRQTMQVRQFLGNWAHHVNSWTNQKRVPVLVIRYEDLLENPFLNFNKLVKFLNIKTNETIIRRAIDNSSFKKLQKKENLEGGFTEKPYKCKNFFRSGKSGEGIEKLNRYQIDELIKKFSKTLKKYNYLN